MILKNFESFSLSFHPTNHPLCIFATLSLFFLIYEDIDIESARVCTLNIEGYFSSIYSCYLTHSFSFLGDNKIYMIISSQKSVFTLLKRKFSNDTTKLSWEHFYFNFNAYPFIFMERIIYQRILLIFSLLYAGFNFNFYISQIPIKS